MRLFLFLCLLFIQLSCATTSKNSTTAFIDLPNTKVIEEGDLEPVRAAIAEKRIVMLGESIHITREFSKARDVLIRNLHTRGSYNLLFFEGSPIEFWIAEDIFLTSKRDDQAVSKFQKTALFGLWQTPEIRSVLSHALASQRDSNPSPLYVSSYDVQIGQGRIFSSGKLEVFPEFVKRLKKAGFYISSSDEQKILTLENLAYCKRKKFPAASKDFGDALEIIQKLDNKIQQNKIQSLSTVHSQFLSFIPNSLRFSLEFCREINSGKRNYTEVRDEWGSRQFQELLSRTKEKVIIWAHSGHVRQGPKGEGIMSFGAYMRKNNPDEIFSLSFIGKQGSAISFLDKQGNETELTEKSLIPLSKVSLENKLSKLSQKDFFFTPIKSNSYLDDRETSRMEPDLVEFINPQKDFDGYYFIHNISPPRLYLP